MTTNHKLFQSAALAERYLARSLEAYRRACILDAQSGECAVGYDDAYDDLGRCTDASLAAARDIVATDPDAWHAAIVASETDDGSGAVGVEHLCSMLGAAIANGDTFNGADLAYCGPLLRSDAAAEWFRAIGNAVDAATADRLKKENDEN